MHINTHEHIHTYDIYAKQKCVCKSIQFIPRYILLAYDACAYLNLCTYSKIVPKTKREEQQFLIFPLYRSVSP